MLALSLFCQDARDEVGGTMSLIGLLPDNIVISVGSLVPKLVVFTRINIDVNDPVLAIDVCLRSPDGTDLITNTVELEKVQQAITEARRDENSVGGILTRIEGSPFAPALGRYKVIVKYDGKEYVTGSIRFVLKGSESGAV
jgi:hypothetical protein